MKLISLDLSLRLITKMGCDTTHTHYTPTHYHPPQTFRRDLGFAAQAQHHHYHQGDNAFFQQLEPDIAL